MGYRQLQDHILLPCVSKMLEKIFYNCVYKHLPENNHLYKKQFGFDKGRSTEHAMTQLVDNINNSFDKNFFTLGVFIGLSNAFDTVDHEILISKLEKHRVLGNNP